MERAKAKRISADHEHRLLIWDLGASQEGEPEEDILNHRIKMVQVVGEFDGASVEIRGSVIPGEMDALSDYDSVPLIFGMAGIKSTDDRVTALMPRVVGGGERTALKVGILFHR